MSEDASLRLASLLTSRLCHDLVGPLGAVDNGLELIAEGGGMEDEALALAQRSAKRATGRLQFLRYAFGAAGEDMGYATSEARNLAQNLLQGSETHLDWPAAGDQALPAGAGRLALNLILLAVDCLPRGGRIRLSLQASQLIAECRGTNARMTPELRAAIKGETAPAELTARTVVGHYAALLASALGGVLAVQEETDLIRLQVGLRPLSRP